MRYTLVLLFTLYASANAFAQFADKEHKYTIKLNVQATLDRGHELGSMAGPDIFQSDILKPTIGFQVRTHNLNQHEIELSGLRVGETSTQIANFNPGPPFSFISNSTQITTTTVSLRYEYILGFIKRKQTRIKPSLGFAAMPWYEYHFIVPDVPFHSEKEHFIGAKFFVIPHISCALSKRVFVDFNTPLCLLDVFQHKLTVSDPTLPRSARSTSSVNLEAVPVYLSGRLGIGVKL